MADNETLQGDRDAQVLKKYILVGNMLRSLASIYILYMQSRELQRLKASSKDRNKVTQLKQHLQELESVRPLWISSAQDISFTKEIQYAICALETPQSAL